MNNITITWTNAPSIASPVTWNSTYSLQTSIDKNECEYENKLEECISFLPPIVKLIMKSSYSGAIAGGNNNGEIFMSVINCINIRNRLLQEIQRTQCNFLTKKESNILEKMYNDDILYLKFILFHEYAHKYLNRGNSPFHLYNDEYRKHPIERSADLMGIKILTKCFIKSRKRKVKKTVLDQIVQEVDSLIC
jgi:hypothetical protein